MKNYYLFINRISLKGSIVDGPGIRNVIFFQGCNKKCFNCQNQETWDIKKGKKVEVNDIVKFIMKKSNNRRITISGGEPLMQYESLIELLKLLNKNNFDIALYTGKDIQSIPEEIIKYLNYLKYGEYIDELKTTLDYFGSKNQVFLKLKEPSF